MATFNDTWLGLQQSGVGMPFVLIDCAGIDGGQAQIPRNVFSEFESLFTGDLADELADVGPYLGRLGSYSATARAAIEGLLNRQAALLAVPAGGAEGAGTAAALTFSQVHRHFRKFNVVYDPTGKPLFFRYFDPRVLVDVLTVLEPKQVEAFFGPIDRFILADAQGQLLQCLQRDGACTVLA